MCVYIYIYMLYVYIQHIRIHVHMLYMYTYIYMLCYSYGRYLYDNINNNCKVHTESDWSTDQPGMTTDIRDFRLRLWVPRFELHIFFLGFWVLGSGNLDQQYVNVDYVGFSNTYIPVSSNMAMKKDHLLVIFLFKPPFIDDFPLPCLITGGYIRLAPPQIQKKNVLYRKSLMKRYHGPCDPLDTKLIDGLEQALVFLKAS